MPNFCRQAIAAIASILLNTAAGAYGEATIAAFAIGNRLVMMMGVVMIGFGQGFQPVCAYNYGAGKNERLRSSDHSYGDSAPKMAMLISTYIGMGDHQWYVFAEYWTV